VLLFRTFLGRNAGKVDHGKKPKKMRKGNLVVKIPDPVGRTLEAIGSKTGRNKIRRSRAEKNRKRRLNLRARKQQKQEVPKAAASAA
jgi:hypothetical protein